MKKYVRGILPLSGDPITWGHIDLIRRAGEECEELVVAFLSNPAKKGAYVFEEKERVWHAQKAIEDFCPQTISRVIAVEGSLSDVYLKEGCDVVFRGVRDSFDREYEEQQLLYHEIVIPGIREHTIIFEADPNLRHVQSTVARNLAVEHIDVTSIVPMFVQARLWRAIHKQKFIGVTGLPGVGKSFIIQASMQTVRESGFPTHHIDMQQLQTELLQEDSVGARELRGRLEAFSGSELPEDLRRLYYANLSRVYRRAIHGRSGVIFVEGSFLAEDGLLHWVNNNLVVITGSDFVNTKRVKRSWGAEWDSEEKIVAGKEMAAKDHFGTVFSIENEKSGFPAGLGGVVVAKIQSANGGF